MATSPDSRNSYDALPYLAHTVSDTSPDRMAAMAILFGMTPGDPRRCRVLEIGCASGDNLFPMAVAMPEAKFVGIDLSPRQIADGQSTIAVLGLTNVSLRTLSLLDIGDDFGLFDYIICHGVYSWVPPAASAKILSIFARNLAPDGVGFLSYNTYPGWHFRGMVREMLNYHSDLASEPLERVKEARKFLDFLVHAVPEREGAYASVLKGEQAMIEPTGDTYVFHEHLEDHNHPVYFHELVADAAMHGLSYLGPSRFDMTDDNLPPTIQGALDQLGTDRIRREQYLDFVRNRMFRKSLFCHADRSHLATPSLAALERLRFSSLAKPQSERPDVRSEAPEEFCSPTDDRLTTTKPLVKAALTALFRAWPGSLTLDRLWDDARELLGPDLAAPADVDRDMLSSILLKAHVSNLVGLHAYEPSFVVEAGERPVATVVSRYQAEAEINVVNLRHRVVSLDDFDRLMIRLLDGSRDRPAIVAVLEQWAAEGIFEVSRQSQSVEDPAVIREAITECVDVALVKLARYALLTA
jgi:methyltransferase-like protein/cyclopropane fatty-acyl-phospholipid synthase-like methyltransferase